MFLTKMDIQFVWKTLGFEPVEALTCEKWVIKVGKLRLARENC